MRCVTGAEFTVGAMILSNILVLRTNPMRKQTLLKGGEGELRMISSFRTNFEWSPSLPIVWLSLNFGKGI